MRGIYDGVKVGNMALARECFTGVAEALAGRHGLSTLVLGCTEIPLALSAVPGMEAWTWWTRRRCWPRRWRSGPTPPAFSRRRRSSGYPRPCRACAGRAWSAGRAPGAGRVARQAALFGRLGLQAQAFFGFFIELLGHGRRTALLADAAHHHCAVDRALPQRHGVAGFDFARGLGFGAVDRDTALVYFLDRERAGFVETGGPQPFVDAQFIHWGLF
jgi:hypothetical protein